MKRFIFLIIYYSLFRYLPKSSNTIIGRLSNWLRLICVKRIFKKCGKGLTIQRGAYFGNGSKVEIGDYSGLGVNCVVPSTIKIGKNVMMGPDVLIYDINHNHYLKEIPMAKQGFTEKSELIIEDDVWIGTRVIILPSVTRIMKGSIIGAGAIMTKNHVGYSIIAGNPAKVVKMR